MPSLSSLVTALLLFLAAPTFAGTTVAFSERYVRFGLSYGESNMALGERKALFSCKEKLPAQVTSDCRVVYREKEAGFGAVALSDTAVFIAAGYADEKSATERVLEICRVRRHACTVQVNFYDPTRGNDILERLAKKQQRSDSEQ